MEAMLDKLRSIEERYEEIDRLMADPEVSADYSRVKALAKEQASLKGLALLSRESRSVLRDLEEAQSISRDESDREVADLARGTGQPLRRTARTRLRRRPGGLEP